MFFKLAVILTLSLTTFKVFAADPTSEEKRVIAAQQEAARKAQQANIDGQLALDSYQTAIDRWGKAVAGAAASAATRVSNGASNLAARVLSSNDEILSPDSATLADMRTRVVESREAQIAAQKAREKAAGSLGQATNATITAFKSDLGSLTASTTAAAKAAYQSATDAKNELLIKSIGLTSNFNSLNSNYSNVNDRMIMIERALDKSVMAAYIQEKMVKLLNSDTFCKASSANSCKDGKNNSQIKPIDLKSVFPSNDSGSANRPAMLNNNTSAGAGAVKQ